MKKISSIPVLGIIAKTCLTRLLLHTAIKDDCQIRLSVVETYFQNAMGIPLPFILLFVVQTLIFLYVYYNSTFKDEERR